MKPHFPTFSLIVCLTAVFILCALGIWQVQRLSWKNNLQQNLNREFAKDISQSPLLPEDFDAAEMKRGFVIGLPDMSKAILLHGRVTEGRSILSVVAPVQIATSRYIAVEIGCAGKPDLDSLRQKGSTKPAHFTGVLRQPRWSYWAPLNHPDAMDWWRLDVQQLADYWGVDSVAPMVMTAETAPSFAADLEACPIEVSLRNDHLSYAIFWFTMAIVLGGMWGLRFLRPYLQSA